MLAIATGLVLAGPAVAQEPKLVGDFKDWSVFSYDGDKGKVCYIVSQPKDSQPSDVKRDPVFFMVSHRPGEDVRSEVNVFIGYPFKKESTLDIDIDGNNYELITSGDGAWAESSEADTEVVGAMKAGRNMTVKGESWRGTKTTDKFSLSGVTAAMGKIDTLCKE